MDPTSKEFNYTFDLLKKELHNFKSEQNKLKFRISSLMDENRRLANELKENIQLRLSEFPQDSNISNLEQKLQCALASKNAAMEMWQVALQELEKNEDLLVGKRSVVASEMKEVDKRIDQVKIDYMKGLNVLSDELSETRSELCKVKKELDSKLVELEELKKLSDCDAEKLKTSQKMAESYAVDKKAMNGKIVSLELLLADIEKVLTSNKEEMSVIHSRNKELEHSNSELKEQNTKLRSQILIFEKDAKDSLLTAQEAVLQKKEIAYKEEQALKQIQELKSSVNLEVEKSSLRFKSEIKNVQKQSAEKIKSLMEEIQTLHRENGEKQSMFERASREKQALESKLELLNSESASGLPITSEIFEDLCKRLTMAERARDEHELKALSLETTLKELRNSNEHEIQYLRGEQSNLKERLQNMIGDFSQASSDRLKLNDDVTKLKRRCLDLEKELKTKKTKYESELALLDERLHQKQQECDERLKISEEHHQKMCSELQHLLDAEFKISNKWRDAVQELALKSEIKINELCESLNFLQIRNEQLTQALQKTKALPSASLPSHDISGL